MKKLDKNLLARNVVQTAEDDMARHKAFGSAYWVMQDGETVYERCFGCTSAHGAEPVTADTLFRMASMTKPVTAFAALILVDRGLLRLSDPVAMYLPEFRGVPITEAAEDGSLRTVGAPRNEPTIRHILTHTSGIGSDGRKIAHMTAEDKRTVANTVAFHARMGLDFDPGTRQQYSGSGAFDALVKIIEQITKTDFLSFLQKEIFDPCGMRDTTFTPTAEQWKRMTAMHTVVDGQNADAPMREGCVMSDYPCTHYLGGSGLASTLSDYAAFATMLLNRGQTARGRLVSEDTFSLLCTPAVSEAIMPIHERWGLGVRVITKEYYEDLPVGSFGWSGAYGTHFFVDPVNKVAGVYLRNSLVDGGSGSEAARNFERAVHRSFIAM
ncbi:MAG: beta-lactamase family protein [Clostridia bacterium]|nr:beta-lactamase family protein [Clostridia bacterium]